MPARSEARGGALFLAAGILAGVGHYGYQVLASRALDAATFATFTAWLAHLSVGFVAAALAQYFANFRPRGGAPLRRTLVVLNGICLVTAGALDFVSESFGMGSILSVVILAVGFGWTAGQTQIRLDFAGLAAAQILNALLKLTPPLLLATSATNFTRGLAWGFVGPIFFLSTRLWRNPQSALPTTTANWSAPVVLAIAANVLPQFDLLVGRHALAAADFESLARASLFFKAIYFAVFTFAQWRLPRQLRGEGAGRGLVWVGAFALFGTLGLTAVTPLVGKHVLGWIDGPSEGLVFCTCLHVSLLTMVFLKIQAACVRGRWRVPAVFLGLLGLEAGTAFLGRPPLFIYLSAVILLQTALLGAASLRRA